MDVSAKVTDAYQLAVKTRAHAHAPYSKYKVGAALGIAEHSAAIGGCNVENASFGGTVCAERTAILSAVAARGAITPEFMVVVVDEPKAQPPCALCLQVICEFAPDDFTIYLANLEGVQSRHALSELLPFPFRAFAPGAR